MGLQEDTPLVKPSPIDRPAPFITAPSEHDDIGADYRSLGLTLRRHPMRVLRESSDAFHQCLRATDLTTLRHGRFVQIAGLVTGRQRPSTASGIIFMTVEDETQNINVVIQHHVQAHFRKAVLHSQLIRIKGILEKENGVIHVVAGHLTDLSHLLSGFTIRSRDFH
jgi:error-prone DNA polymerase